MDVGNSDGQQPCPSHQVSRPIQQYSGPLGNKAGRSDNNLEHNQQQAPQKINVPADGSCLFWAVALAYLIPVKNNDALFRQRYEALFGNGDTGLQKLGSVRKSIQNYNPLSDSAPNCNEFSDLVRNTFRHKVVNYMDRNLNRFENFSKVSDIQYIFNMRNPETWAGDPEIQAICFMLNCRINVDGQIFPLVTNEIELNDNFEIRLFCVNFSTKNVENANHYNYGLEQSIIDNFRNSLIQDITKCLIQENFKESETSKASIVNDGENCELSSETIKDIAKVKWFGRNSKVVFEVTSASEIDVQLLTQHQETLRANHENSLVVIIDLGDLHWVTLVVTYKNQQLQGHYVDSLGEKLSDIIKSVWSQINTNENNAIRDCTIKKGNRFKYNSGIFVFKDAEVIIEKLQDKGVDIRNQIIKRLQQKSYCSDVSLKRERKKFMEKIEEKNKMEDKIEVCLKLLESLTQIENFSSRNANIFTLFLEAIALEDSPNLSKDYLDKIKDEIIGTENSALVKEIRRLLLHSNYERVINSVNLNSTMGNLLNTNIDCRTLFTGLTCYMRNVYEKLKPDKLQNNSNGIEKSEPEVLLKPRNMIAEIHENKHFGKILNDKNEIRDELSKLFIECIERVKQKPNAEYAEKITFYLTLNIMPILENMCSASRNKLRAKGLEEIRKFRNEFFHNFHSHGDSFLELNFVLRQGIHKLLDYFFKYYFSLKVYNEFKLLITACSCQQKTIEQNIETLLNDAQENLKKCFDHTAVPPVLKVLDEKRNLRKLELSNFVHEYLKLMSVIDNEYVINERETKCKTMKNQVKYRKLKGVDTKRIYKEFKELKTSKENNTSDEKDKIKELQSKLRRQCGIWIPLCYLEGMFESYVESDIHLCEFEEIVTNDICALVSIKKDYKLTIQRVIDIYNKFMKGDDIVDLLNKANNKSVREKLGRLKSIRNKSINLSSKFNVKNAKGKKIDVVVDVVKMIGNLLEMLDNHISHPFLYMNIEEIFSDDVFLDYLLNEDINISLNSLTEINMYVTPYVVKLITQNKSRMIEDISRTEVLSNIIENLLKKDTYGDYLKELLEVNTIDYDTVCQNINKDNIQNTYCLFKISKHAAGILGALNNSGKIELVKEAFGLLKKAVVELYRNKEYELIFELLNVEEVESTKDVLLGEDSSDLDVLQVQRTMAKAKRKIGCYEDAIKIFNSIKDRILNDESSDTVPGMRDTHRYKLYLLVSSDIVYTEQSYEKYKALFGELIKFTINRDASCLQCSIYKEILQSENYLSLLALNPKNLNILKIRSDIAYQLRRLANEEQVFFPHNESQDYETKLNEVLQHYQEALDIYEEVYEIKITDAGFNQDIVKTMRDIAFVNNKLASLKSSALNNEELLNQALSHYSKAFEIYARVLSIQCKEKWETHPANSRTVQDILHALRNIAYTRNKLGNLKLQNNSEEAIQYYEMALKVYECVYEIQKDVLNEEHENTLNTLNDVAYTNNCLARAIASDDNTDRLPQALKHYDVALNIYNELKHKPSWENASEAHSKTRKWKNQVKRRLNPSKNQESPPKNPPC